MIKEILFKTLDNAESLASKYSGGYSGQFSSAQEFHLSLTESIEKLKSGDDSQLDKFKIWFLPTSAWDDFVGFEGQDLANQISDILIQMKNY